MKSLSINLLALALFAATAAVAGVFSTESLLFQLAAQWLVNELWFAAYLVPALLLQFFGGKGEEREHARQRRAARWTSFLLLLLPPLLFGLLALVEKLSSGSLSEALSLPLGASLYSCSFAAFFLLFLLTLFTGSMPLSVQALVENFFDDKCDSMAAQVRDAIAQEAAAHEPPAQPALAACDVAPAAIPCHHSRRYAAHEADFERKRQPGEVLLLATAPVGAVSCEGDIMSYLAGGFFSLAGAALLPLGYSLMQAGELPGLALAAIFIMGAGFLSLGLPVLLHPLLQRRRLLGIDYFITDRRLIIYRGSRQHIVTWESPCATHLTLRNGSCGDVEVIRKGLGYAILRGAFKLWTRASEEETRRSFDRGRFQDGSKNIQTQALINVEGAEAIHSLILSLLADKQEGQERRSSSAPHEER